MTYQSQAKTAKQWAEEIGTSRGAIYHGWKLGQFKRNGAYFTPIDERATEPAHAERRREEGALSLKLEAELKAAQARIAELEAELLQHREIAMRAIIDEFSAFIAERGEVGQ